MKNEKLSKNGFRFVKSYIVEPKPKRVVKPFNPLDVEDLTRPSGDKR